MEAVVFAIAAVGAGIGWFRAAREARIERFRAKILERALRRRGEIVAEMRTQLRHSRRPPHG